MGSYGQVHRCFRLRACDDLCGLYAFFLRLTEIHLSAVRLCVSRFPEKWTQNWWLSTFEKLNLVFVSQVLTSIICHYVPCFPCSWRIYFCSRDLCSASGLRLPSLRLLSEFHNWQARFGDSGDLFGRCLGSNWRGKKLHERSYKVLKTTEEPYKQT